MNEIETAKKMMEDGWKAREDLRFDEADKLLTDAKDIFEKNNDWYNVTECLNHLAYNDKLKAQKNLNFGLEKVTDALAISKEHSTKELSIYRAQMSVLSALGNFEESLKIAKKLLSLTTKPANQADILTHIATFELRTGKLNESQESLKMAASLLQNAWKEEREPHRSIWKTSILITESLVLYNLGKLDDSRNIANEALLLSQSQNLKTRINQVLQILAMLDDRS